MSIIKLFTDGSVDVATGVGYGAYLVIGEGFDSIEELKPLIQVKRFENTTSTRLELETLLWALCNIKTENRKKIQVFTDSQNLINLNYRRVRLETKNYHSNNNRLLKNHELYKEYFRMMDSMNIELIKIKGHQPSVSKDNIHQIFTLVDRASRYALRQESKL